MKRPYEKPCMCIVTCLTSMMLTSSPNQPTWGNNQGWADFSEKEVSADEAE